MKKIVIAAFCMLSFVSCKNFSEKNLQRKMIPLAKDFLKEDNITNYKNLKIKCVDTITEASYAKLNSELLANMETAYEQMFADENANKEVLSLYLNDIVRTKNDMDDLLESGDLNTKDILLFMVTATYNIDNQEEERMFLVNPDKKSLHTLDPFGDNLLYKE